MLDKNLYNFQNIFPWVGKEILENNIFVSTTLFENNLFNRNQHSIKMKVEIKTEIRNILIRFIFFLIFKNECTKSLYIYQKMRFVIVG